MLLRSPQDSQSDGQMSKGEMLVPAKPRVKLPLVSLDSAIYP